MKLLVAILMYISTFMIPSGSSSIVPSTKINILFFNKNKSNNTTSKLLIRNNDLLNNSNIKVVYDEDIFDYYLSLFIPN